MGLRSRVEGTHLWGQIHEQHGSHRALGLAVALFRPIQGVGLEYLEEPLLPVPEDPVRGQSSGHPFPTLWWPLPRPQPPEGLAGSFEMQRYKAGAGGWVLGQSTWGLWGWGSLGITGLIPVTLG